MTTADAHQRFRRDLEGLRGLAILLVVAYHVHVPGFSGGYIGVDVFFVLSGYLITGLLKRELDTTGRVDLAGFYARRARRLLPAASLVLMATLAVAWWVYAPFQQQAFTGTALATAGYISNFWFAKEATEYLAPDVAANPFLHTWSLSVEEQFYLLWPALLTVAAWLAVGRRRTGRIAVLVGALAAASLALCVWVTGIAQPWAFFSSPTRAWEFALGGLGALLRVSRLQRSRFARELLPSAGVTAILIAAVAFGAGTRFPGYAALLPAIGTAVVVTMYDAAAPSMIATSLSLGPMTFLGRVSYSWYLWHWPALTLAGALTERSDISIRVAAVVAALLLSWITFTWWEHPIRSSRWLALRPRLSLAMAGCLTLTTVTMSAVVREAARRAAATPAQREYTLAWHDIPAVYSLGCHLSYLDAASSHACAFGDRSSPVTIVLFGDSHAAQWFPAVERLANEKGWRLLSWTKSACPAAQVERVEPALGREYVECDRWREATVERIVELRPRAVVMSSASLYVTRSGAPDSVGTVSVRDWQTGTRKTLSRFSDAGIPTVLVADVPRPGFDVPACLARAAWNRTLFGNFCTFEQGEAINAAASEAERRVAIEFPKVVEIDSSPAICDHSLCKPEQGGIVVYRDKDHVTTQFAMSLLPVFDRQLANALGSH